MEEVLEVGAALESSDGRSLDRGAIQSGIRVGETEFDDVNTAIRQNFARANRILDRREADGQVGDERRVATLTGSINGNG